MADLLKYTVASPGVNEALNTKSPVDMISLPKFRAESLSVIVLTSCALVER
jgi:hypothetical protein